MAEESTGESFDLGSIVSGAIDIAGNLFGTNSQISSNNAASANYAEAITNSANVLNRGYDAQLGHIEAGSDALREISDAGLTDVVGVLEGTDAEYADALRDAYSAYGQFIVPRVDEYGNAVQGVTDQFVSDIYGTAADTAQQYQQGAQGYSQDMQPYTHSGEKALQYLNEIMAIDPTQLTPDQRILYDRAKEQAMATLAASGMRGAGRGGVMSVVEGMNTLEADLFAQNQARADKAAYQLASTGYNANTRVADNAQRMSDNIADLTFQTGQQAAQQGFNTGSNIAQTRLKTAEKIGDRQYGAEQNIATHGSKTGGTKANVVGGYYGNIAQIEGARHQARGNTELGKAASSASAAGNVGATKFNTETANANLKNQGIGAITTAASKAAKDYYTKT